jgi:hypothetical protein
LNSLQRSKIGRGSWGHHRIQFAVPIINRFKINQGMRSLKTYIETAGNELNSGVPGEGGVVLVRFLDGVTGATTFSLE